MVNLGPESNKVLPGDSSKSENGRPAMSSSLRLRKPGESTHATVQGESAFSQHSTVEPLSEAETRHGKRVYHTYFMMRIEIWVEKLLSKFDVFKRKHPRVSNILVLVLMLIEEALYVYDLYTDVVVVQFFFKNGYMVAASLSILFITWHYILLAILLTFFLRESLYRMIWPAEALEDEYIRQQASGKDKKRMFSKVWRAGISPIGYYLKASLFFAASFLLGCVVVPVIDIFMLAFDVVAYFFTAKEGEDSNPLNHQFINFLLQYRTLRVPMEVLMQSLPQSVVAVIMYKYLQTHPPVSNTGPASNNFSASSVAQALVASVANMVVNALSVYLATKVSGRTWWRYMIMALKFEGSAQLPPEWDDRTTEATTVIDGNYSHLKLAQQMKILQAVVRRDTVNLLTPGPHTPALPAEWSKPGGTSVGTIMLEHRKMLEFLFEQDGPAGDRRFPTKIADVVETRALAPVHINVIMSRVHQLPMQHDNDTGNDMDINKFQLEELCAAARHETVALRLISDANICDSLVHVRLSDCRLDATFLLPDLPGGYDQEKGPLIRLLGSLTLKHLDLSNNPLFAFIEPDEHMDKFMRAQERDAVRRSQGALGPCSHSPLVKHDLLLYECDLEFDQPVTCDLCQAVQAFSDALKSNRVIQELILSETKMGPHELHALLIALSPSDSTQPCTLQLLDISHNHILRFPPPALEAPPEPSKDSKPPTPSTAALNAERKERWKEERNALIDSMGSMLGKLPCLRGLDLTSTFLRRSDIKNFLGEGLEYNKVITQVDLSCLSIPKAKMEDVMLSLQRLLSQNSSIQSLVLRSMGLTTAAIEILGEGFKNNMGVKMLDLSDNPQIKDKGARSFADALTRRVRRQGFTALLMANCGLGCSGVISLCEALAMMDSLKTLDISSSNLDHVYPPKEPEKLADLILKVTSLQKAVKHLDARLFEEDDLIEGELMEQEASERQKQRREQQRKALVPLIERNKGLPQLVYGVEVMIALGEVLKMNRLEFLAMNKCLLPTVAAMHFADCLEYRLKNKVAGVAEIALVELDLSHNPIGDEAAKEIADVVEHSPTLRSLVLAGVNMTSTGVELMFEALEKNSSLEMLDLTHNFIQSVDEQAFEDFNKANTRLKVLDLRWNNISEKTCAKLVDAFALKTKAAQRNSTMTLSEAVKDFFHLDEVRDQEPYVMRV